jgi:hypothetical protein
LNKELEIVMSTNSSPPTRRSVLKIAAAGGALGLITSASSSFVNPARAAGIADHIAKGKRMSGLEWKLLTKKRMSATQGVPPGKEDLAWVTNTVTLIHGPRDAVLVDTFLSEQHSKELLDWVVASGKNLTTIYVTHGHGDHFFGLKLLLDKFPNAKAIATASVVAAIQDQIKPEYIRSFWEPRFPGQLPSQLTAPEVIKGDTFYLEGEELKVVELGHTDTSHSTALYVPSIGLAYPAMASTTTRTSISRSATKRRGTNGSAHSTKSRRCIHKQWSPVMACSIRIARLATSRKRAVTSVTSTLASGGHRRQSRFTRRCFRCIRTASTPGRCGRPQKPPRRRRSSPDEFFTVPKVW